MADIISWTDPLNPRPDLVRRQIAASYYSLATTVGDIAHQNVKYGISISGPGLAIPSGASPEDYTYVDSFLHRLPDNPYLSNALGDVLTPKDEPYSNLGNASFEDVSEFPVSLSYDHVHSTTLHYLQSRTRIATPIFPYDRRQRKYPRNALVADRPSFFDEQNTLANSERRGKRIYTQEKHLHRSPYNIIIGTEEPISYLLDPIERQKEEAIRSARKRKSGIHYPDDPLSTDDPLIQKMNDNAYLKSLELRRLRQEGY